MRTILIAITLIASTAAVAAEKFPSFPKKTTYGDARTSLVALGWQPARSSEADKCDQGDSRCVGRPEMLACSGTGLARCVFLWKKGERLIEIGTFGEEDPIVVDRIRCRTGC